MSIEFLLGLLLAIPLSILGNVLTRKYDDIMSKRSVSVRAKKLSTVISDYERIKNRSKNPSLLTMIAFREVLSNISILMYLLALWGILNLITLSGLHPSDLTFLFLPSFLQTRLAIDIISAILMFLITIISIIAIQLMQRRINDFENATLFDNYQLSVKQKIEELGGNPEELDKEVAE